jgi:hypothetical protein
LQDEFNLDQEFEIIELETRRAASPDAQTITGTFSGNIGGGSGGSGGSGSGSSLSGSGGSGGSGGASSLSGSGGSGT